MSKYELQKLFFKKSKKLLMTSFFRSRSWSRILPVSVSKPKLRSRPVLVSEKFCDLGLGFGLGRVGLDYSPGPQSRWSPKTNVFAANRCWFRPVLREFAPKVGEDQTKVFDRRKTELISGKPNRRRCRFRPSFYLPRNGKPFHQEINLAKRSCGPLKLASLATGRAVLV